MNNAALGFTLLLAGLAVFASALNKTTGAMLTGLFYGEGALKPPAGKSSDSPMTQSQADNAWAITPPDWSRAGVVPVSPNGGVPGITVPIIPNDSLG